MMHVRALRPWAGILLTLAVVTPPALVLELFAASIGVSWLYFAAVIPITLRWGRVAGVAMAVLGAAVLLGVVLEPHLSLAVAEPGGYLRVIATGFGMLLVVLLVGRQQAARNRRPLRAGAPRRLPARRTGDRLVGGDRRDERRNGHHPWPPGP
jgi:K+-sensing histidine kinase KdpD